METGNPNPVPKSKRSITNSSIEAVDVKVRKMDNISKEKADISSQLKTESAATMPTDNVSPNVFSSEDKSKPNESNFLQQENKSPQSASPLKRSGTKKINNTNISFDVELQASLNDSVEIDAVSTLKHPKLILVKTAVLNNQSALLTQETKKDCESSLSVLGNKSECSPDKGSLPVPENKTEYFSDKGSLNTIGNKGTNVANMSLDLISQAPLNDLVKINAVRPLKHPMVILIKTSGLKSSPLLLTQETKINSEVLKSSTNECALPAPEKKTECSSDNGSLPIPGNKSECYSEKGSLPAPEKRTGCFSSEGSFLTPEKKKISATTFKDIIYGFCHDDFAKAYRKLGPSNIPQCYDIEKCKALHQGIQPKEVNSFQYGHVFNMLDSPFPGWLCDIAPAISLVLNQHQFLRGDMLRVMFDYILNGPNEDLMWDIKAILQTHWTFHPPCTEHMREVYLQLLDRRYPGESFFKTDLVNTGVLQHVLDKLEKILKSTMKAEETIQDRNQLSDDDKLSDCHKSKLTFEVLEERYNNHQPLFDKEKKEVMDTLDAIANCSQMEENKEVLGESEQLDRLTVALEVINELLEADFLICVSRLKSWIKGDCEMKNPLLKDLMDDTFQLRILKLYVTTTKKSVWIQLSKLIGLSAETVHLFRHWETRLWKYPNLNSDCEDFASLVFQEFSKGGWNESERLSRLLLLRPPWLQQRLSLAMANAHLNLDLSAGLHAVMNEEKIDSFKCEYCEKSFRLACYRAKHIRRTHTNHGKGAMLKKDQFLCSVCDQKCSSKYSLQRHMNALHLRSTSFKCDMCSHSFLRKDDLKRHILRAHKNKKRPEKEKKFKCAYCPAVFAAKQSLRRHENNKHKVVRFKRPVDRKCPLCKFSSTARSKQEINDHFKNSHDLNMEWRKLSFPSIEEFDSWKKTIELDTNTSFTKAKFSTSHSLHYLCHRSGKFRSFGSSKRHLKKKGSCKINAHCPCEIIAKIKASGQVLVFYLPTHVGHKNDLEFLRLRPEDRKRLALQLLSNSPRDEILKNSRKSESNEELKRIHLLSNKDLHNIERSFNINKNKKATPPIKKNIVAPPSLDDLVGEQNEIEVLEEVVEEIVGDEDTTIYDCVSPQISDMAADASSTIEEKRQEMIDWFNAIFNEANTEEQMDFVNTNLEAIYQAVKCNGFAS